MGDTTANYNFKKRKIGHPVRDDDVGDNLDLIDAAIKARADGLDALMKVASGALTADASGNMAFIWQNPEDVKILVHRVLIDRTTAGGSASSVLDVGVVDASGNTAANLIDGLDLNATGLADNIEDKGTNGKSRQKLDEKDGTTDWITGKILVADASSLVGKYYLFYTKVAA